MNLIKLISVNKEEQKVCVELEGSHYNIGYCIDEDGTKCLTHNNGYCSDTSDLTMNYPNNEDYASDDELMRILEECDDDD